MSTETGESAIVVLGLGNLLYGDEGFGIAALAALQQALGELPGVDFVDGGVLGLGLLPLVESCTHLLALDAIEAGAAPGTVFELDGADLPLFSPPKLSEHQVGFQEVLALAQFREHLPAHFRVLAVQPGGLEEGIALSPAVSAALGEVVRSGRKILEEWGTWND